MSLTLKDFRTDFLIERNRVPMLMQTVAPWVRSRVRPDQLSFTSQHSPSAAGECAKRTRIGLDIGNGTLNSGYLTDAMLQKGKLVAEAWLERELVGLALYYFKSATEVHVIAIVAAPGSGAGRVLLDRIETLARTHGAQEVTLESLDYTLAKDKNACAHNIDAFDLPLYYAQRDYKQASHCGQAPFQEPPPNDEDDKPIEDIIAMSKCLDPTKTTEVNRRLLDEAQKAWARLRPSVANMPGVQTVDGFGPGAKTAFAALCAGVLDNAWLEKKVPADKRANSLTARMIALSKDPSLIKYDYYNRAIIERYFASLTPDAPRSPLPTPVPPR